MEVNQIYDLVNNVAKQTMGTLPITAVDTRSLVALGDAILSSQDTTINYINNLVQRIGRTIVSYRAYRSQLSGLVFDEIEWGAIVQKLKVSMPEAVEDVSYNLEDGKSIDMFVVNKPKVNCKYFIKETPYTFFITIQRFQLQRAFLSESSMGSFISAIFGEVRNKMELTLENNGRLCMINYMGLAKPSQVINLVTNYNAKTGNAITADSSLYDADFLRYAIGQMSLYSKRMETMSTLYNDGSETRHTPIELQKFAMLADFQTQMETVVQYAAFHEQYVSKVPSMTVPYWQSAQTPFDINAKVSGGESGKSIKIGNIVGFMFDREALGTYRHEEEVLTTPVNARGRYTNTFYHENELWFNDMSENGLVFTLN